MTRVACQQLAPILGDLAGNITRAEAAIVEAADAGAEVIVLPELCTCGYMFDSLAGVARSAVRLDHEVLKRWGHLAVKRGVVLVAGFAELGDDGAVFNSLAIWDGETPEPATVYRKLHLWDREKLLFAHGTELPEVVDTRVGKVAGIICYDLEFPELTRAVAILGAQLLCVPTNWPLVDRPAGERPPEAIIAMATARINRMAVACADRAGVERGQAWTQGTTLVNSDGWVVGERRDEGLLIGEVDLEAALLKRLTEYAHAFDDRRPEFYASLSGPAAAPLAGPTGAPVSGTAGAPRTRSPTRTVPGSSTLP